MSIFGTKKEVEEDTKKFIRDFIRNEYRPKRKPPSKLPLELYPLEGFFILVVVALALLALYVFLR